MNEPEPRDDTRPPEPTEVTRPLRGSENPTASWRPDAAKLPALDRYEIEAPLAAGAHGRVFSARHVALDRRVAIKFLDPARVCRERFHREARLVSQLSHRSVVQVHDAGEAEGVFYLVMELVEGTDLETLVVREGPLPLARAVRIVSDVGSGLAAAHAKGILHRDVKPGNVLFDPGGSRVVLTDFGLAKDEHEADEASITGTGSVLGTPVAMAPEVCRGQAAIEASDQYSLAVLFYYLVAGRYPYLGRNALELLQKHIEDPVPDLAQLAPGCPAGVAAVVARALAKHPRERFPSIRDFVTALRRAARPSRGVPGSVPARLALAAALAIALGAALFSAAGRSPPASPGDLAPAFHATSVRIGEDRQAELLYEFVTPDELQDFSGTGAVRASWRGPGALDLAGRGVWASRALFEDVRIECTVEPGAGEWFFALLYSIEEGARSVSGILAVYPDHEAEAAIEAHGLGDLARRALVREPRMLPADLVTVAFERRGDRWIFEVPDRALEAPFPVTATGAPAISGSGTVRRVRIEGRLDRAPGQ